MILLCYQRLAIQNRVTRTSPKIFVLLATRQASVQALRGRGCVNSDSLGLAPDTSGREFLSYKPPFYKSYYNDINIPSRSLTPSLHFQRLSNRPEGSRSPCTAEKAKCRGSTIGMVLPTQILLRAPITSSSSAFGVDRFGRLEDQYSKARFKSVRMISNGPL